ncbi:hypothetical protein BDB01DRAFT_837566 [Pilobolus umbonatus]|nr:hypothetical protein BDB01DRAFT_837566 [Pilobolus umbonatus]
MRVLLSSLSGLWGITLLIHLHTVLKPFNDEQRLQCMTSNRLAEIVCVLVRFCSQAIQDPLCFPLTMTVIGCATTTYAIMSVERIRCDKRRNLTPWMILLGNLIGTGIVVPLIWIPFYSHLPLHPVPVYPHAYRVGTAIVLAQCVPVLMILMTQSECIIRLFQYCFIVYEEVYILFTGYWLPLIHCYIIPFCTHYHGHLSLNGFIFFTLDHTQSLICSFLTSSHSICLLSTGVHSKKDGKE